MSRRVVLDLAPAEHPPSLEDARALAAPAAARLGVPVAEVAAVRPTRISFDARPRHRRWRVEADVWTTAENVPPAPVHAPPRLAPPPADAPHVVVVGSGPAGTFCALDLLAAGVRVTVLERGRDVQTRRHSIAELNRGKPADPDSNYCFGEGGAGTYSDGKLYTRTGDAGSVRGVLETLVAHGAPPDVLVSWRPHVGSNRLPQVVAALRETLLSAGAAVRFGARAEKLRTRDGAVHAVVVRDLDPNGSGGEQALERIECDAVVLAAGHSALDAVRMARRAGARLEPKGFAMGVRIEHPQPWLDARQYGGLREHHDLPASFYEVTTESGGRGVYSFCMCPGGFIVPATTAPDRVVVNGMSLSRRDSPFANAGLVVAIEPEDWCGGRGVSWGWLELLGLERLPDAPDEDPLFGVRLQLALERLAATAGGGGNRAPVQRADAFLAGDGVPEALPTSYRPGLAPVDLAQLLPRGLTKRLRGALRTFDRRLPGFASDQGQLVGVETRTSSPVRLARDPETLEAAGVGGLFPCGEGAGHAGGIVSAALDGRRVAAAAARTVLSR